MSKALARIMVCHEGDFIPNCEVSLSERTFWSSERSFILFEEVLLSLCRQSK